MISSTWWSSLTATIGVARSESWPELAARLRACASKPHADQGWSPVIFKDARRSGANAEWCFGVGLDIDVGGDPNLVAAALSSFRGLVHSTRSHTSAAPRCRAIVLLDKPVPAAKYALALEHLVGILSASGIAIDRAAVDVSRLWFVPSRDAEDNAGIAIDLTGEALDTSQIETTSSEKPTPNGSTNAKKEYKSASKRARVALENAVSELRRATAGGNPTLARLGFHVGGYIGSGELEALVAAMSLESAIAHWSDLPRHINTLSRALEAGAEKPHAAEEAGANEPSRRFMRTDLGNAERLIARHGNDLRFAPGIGWLAWTGTHWSRDESGEVQRRAKLSARSIYAEAEHARDAAEAKEIAAWAAKSESRDKIAAAVALATTEAAVVAKASSLDADPMLINVQNGTLDLRTGKLRKHDRADLMTKLAGCAFDPDMPTPLWTAFLERMLPDRDVQSFLQRWAGYCLSGSAIEHALLFAYGLGRNGKGVFLLTNRKMLGDYAVKAPRGLLMAKRNESHPTELMGLRGARMAWCSEVDESAIWDQAKVKDLASDDPVTAHYMRCDDVEFMPTHKLVIAGNFKPRVDVSDEALFRRLRLVPFTVTIAEAEKDLHLATKLEAELPGILAWAVRGCLDWQRDGLGCPAAVADATAAYRDEQDTVGRFIADRCVVADPRDADRIRVGSTAIYQAFCAWCEEQGERGVLNQRRFGEQLARRDFTKKHTERGATYCGLGLAVADGLTGADGFSTMNRAVWSS